MASGDQFRSKIGLNPYSVCAALYSAFYLSVRLLATYSVSFHCWFQLICRKQAYYPWSSNGSIMKTAIIDDCECFNVCLKWASCYNQIPNSHTITTTVTHSTVILPTAVIFITAVYCITEPIMNTISVDPQFLKDFTPGKYVKLCINVGTWSACF